MSPACRGQHGASESRDCRHCCRHGTVAKVCLTYPRLEHQSQLHNFSSKLDLAHRISESWSHHKTCMCERCTKLGTKLAQPYLTRNTSETLWAAINQTGKQIEHITSESNTNWFLSCHGEDTSHSTLAKLIQIWHHSLACKLVPVNRHRRNQC